MSGNSSADFSAAIRLNVGDPTAGVAPSSVAPPAFLAPAEQLAKLQDAQAALRALLGDLRGQVSAAVDQSERLRAGMTQAHSATAELHDAARYLPDAGGVQLQIDT